MNKTLKLMSTAAVLATGLAASNLAMANETTAITPSDPLQLIYNSSQTPDLKINGEGCGASAKCDPQPGHMSSTWSSFTIHSSKGGDATVDVNELTNDDNGLSPNGVIQAQLNKKITTYKPRLDLQIFLTSKFEKCHKDSGPVVLPPSQNTFTTGAYTVCINGASNSG